MGRSKPKSPVSLASITEAAHRLGGHVRVTPTWQANPSEFALGGPAPASLFLKLEHLQHSGTFKARGAANFLLCNPISEAGVVAASGGNHGAAVAWAAAQFNHPATIFVPTIAAAAKVKRLGDYGANVRQIGSVFAEAHAASEEFRIQSGATPIHAYNDPVVMAGAGTTGLEFQRQVNELDGEGPLDTILVACGGGGLAGGIASAVSAAAKDGSNPTKIVVCETYGTATYAKALQAGEPVDIVVEGKAADALGASKLGTNTWAALQAAEASSALVSDEALASAQHHLWTSLRLLVEPAAAAPLAVLQTGAYECSPGERVGILLCGANTSDIPAN